MICGNCGHRLSHTYAGRPKYYCAKHYLDKTDGKCNISVLDENMEDEMSVTVIATGFADSDAFIKSNEGGRQTAKKSMQRPMTDRRQTAYAQPTQQAQPARKLTNQADDDDDTYYDIMSIFSRK